MALVVLLRGINIGGRRTLRPSQLASRLGHLDAVNIGATGTFVVRKPVSPSRLHSEVARRLPFETEIVICDGRDIARLLARDPFARQRVASNVVRFVSVLAQQPRSAPRLPLRFPARGAWLMKVLAREGRFVVGLHRREMRVLSQLAKLRELFGVPYTTRSWSTIVAIGKALAMPAER